MSRRIPRILAVLVGTFLATVAVTSPANADPTANASLTGATLVAKGAAVDVSFAYTCSPAGGDFDQWTVFLSQRVGGGRIIFAGGSQVEPPVCDGVQHTSVFTILSQSPRFKKGDALVNWSLTVCDPFTCTSVGAADAVRIR